MSADLNKYMLRAIELARKGLGKVSPNPMVGCVIVHNDQIIGEGYHKRFGEEHAEVNAINSVKNKSLLESADLYVTLEPCSHHGKTPPCAELIISNKIRKVFVCNEDPNPKVAGRGIELLRKASVEVDVGLLSNEGEKLNRRFFTRMRKNRPYVILKWAETMDGFIARKNFDSKWISNESSRALVHQWRGEEDAIMVGTNTVKYDNPRLNIRVGEGNDPVRVVIDKNLSLSKELNVFDNTQLSLIYNLVRRSNESSNLEFVKLNKNLLLPQILSDLNRRAIQSVIVEGGTFLLNSFLQEGLVDEIRVFKSEKVFGAGIPAPRISETIFELDSADNIDGDQLKIYSILLK